MTARNLIRRSLQLIGVVGQGEEVSADDASDALTALNDMLSSWSAEGDSVFEEAKDMHTLTSAVSYTIGSGADIDTVRPVRIVAAFTRSGNIDYPIELKDQKFYASISQKSLGSSFPDYLYYDGGFPTGTIYLWPAPLSGTELHIYSQKLLTNIASLDTAINLPPGYDRAIRYNLACELAPEYGKPIPAKVEQIAIDSKKIIENANRINDEDLLTVDSALLRQDTFNIYGGY